MTATGDTAGDDGAKAGSAVVHPLPLRQRVWEFIYANKGKAAAWLGGGGLTLIDQYLTQFVPISAELRAKALTFSLAFSFAAVLLAWVCIHTLGQSAARLKLLWGLAAGMVVTLGLTLGAYLLYLSTERSWKAKGLSDDAAEAILVFWEPLSYAAVFGCLASFLVFAGTLLKELFEDFEARNRSHPGPPDAAAITTDRSSTNPIDGAG
jgi:hypothetical protein